MCPDNWKLLGLKRVRLCFWCRWTGEQTHYLLDSWRARLP